MTIWVKEWSIEAMRSLRKSLLKYNYSLIRKTVNFEIKNVALFSIAITLSISMYIVRTHNLKQYTEGFVIVKSLVTVIDIYAQVDREIRLNLTTGEEYCSFSPQGHRNEGGGLIRTFEAFTLSLQQFGVECLLCLRVPLCVHACM